MIYRWKIVETIYKKKKKKKLDVLIGGTLFFTEALSVLEASSLSVEMSAK